MISPMRSRLGLVSAVALLASLALSFPATAPAAKRSAKAPADPPAAAPETVELFAAIDAGQIDAKFILKNSEQGRVLITNKTKRPLDVRLPKAFAGVPVLAQFGQAAPGGANGIFGANGPGQAFGGGQGTQTVGAGANQNNGRGALGAFNIPAEKTSEIKVACVCLEHGKPNPRPAIPYRLAPIESVSKDPALQALLGGLGADRYSQRAAQAAAWHLANDMSWEELAAEQVERLVGPHEPYFSAKELGEAHEIVKQVSAAAKSAEEPAGESLSRRPG